VNINERLQFLLQSTESLHLNVQELTGSVTELRATVTELRSSVVDLKRVVEIDAENIGSLANIAAAHPDAA
jgi:prefoldin subunit 5